MILLSWNKILFSGTLFCVILSQVNCDDKSSQIKRSDYIGELEERSFSEGNILAGITNLTGSYFLFKALLIYWIHFAFQTVGWFLSSLVWNSLRPGVNSLDPDIPLSVTDGLINGDFAFSNLALAAGQWVFYFIFWTGILFLFSQSTSRQNQSRSGSSDQTARGDFDIGENGLLVALDDLFNPHTIAKQTVINTVGAVGGSIFVALMSYLPDSDNNSGKRNFDEGDNHQDLIHQSYNIISDNQYYDVSY